MSSSDAKVNDKVDFEILEDVRVGDVIVIQHSLEWTMAATSV